jgi:ligand-binding SRPBCC domain-containing protein
MRGGMPAIDHTITVGAPAAAVFPYLTDPDKAVAWQSSLREARFAPEGPMQAGTRITEVRKILGRRMESTVEVTEFERERLLAGRVVSGPFPWEFRYTFDEADGSTRMNVHLEGEPAGFFRIAEPLVVRAMTRELKSDFATLKELVESGA